MGGGPGLSGALLGRPKLLVAAVALLVAAPLLILGQTSDNDTRERFTGAQIESATHEAEVVSSSFNDREVQLQATLAALALTPTPDRSPARARRARHFPARVISGGTVRRGDLLTRL